MKNLFKRNIVNILIAGAIAIPLSIYGISQQPERQIPDPEVYTYEEPTAATEAESQPEIVTEEMPETEIPVVEETETQIKEVKYFDVPLSHELQDFIFAECEANNLTPATIISMMDQESDFDPNKIGDGGDSLGIMQIQPKWHYERMERLGCMDLFDPYQNIKVGIDYLCELINENPELYWVLMAYNGGADYADEMIASGNISDYALEVVERAQQLTESIEN